jgi:hypothetical protein
MRARRGKDFYRGQVFAFNPEDKAGARKGGFPGYPEVQAF